MQNARVDIERERVRAWSDQACVEVSCPQPGIFRVRAAPAGRLSSVEFPKLPSKRSFAVVTERAEPLGVDREEGRLRVRGGEGGTLELELSSFGWRLLEPDGAVRARCVELRGEAKVGYPAPFYRSTLVLDAPPNEAWLGFGEKVGPVDKRGMHLTFWNTDVIPHHPDTDPLYVSIPFFLALRGGVAWGLFLDESWRSEVDVALAHPQRLVWDVNGPELDLYLLLGPTPAQVLQRYTALTGRAPLPPLWSLGAHQSRWGYESDEDVLSVIRAYRDRGLPLDAVHIDIDHYRGFQPWTWDRSRFPDPTAMVKEASAQGVRLVTIVDPAIRQLPGDPLYDEAVANDRLVRTDRGEVLVGEVWPRPCVFPDFTREEVQAWWASLHRDALARGIRGFWNDMNEPSAFSVRDEDNDLSPPSTARGLPATVEGKTLPYDARHGSKRHLEVHNVYALGMARATARAFEEHAPAQRPFILTRAAFAGIQRYAAVWTGDNSSHWGHLDLSVSMLLGLSVSGVPWVGADIPGFLGRPSGELFARWMELGVFYPFMRNHSARGTPPKEPWRFGEPWLTFARAALERRYRLLPTLYTLGWEAAQTGMPILRPLAFHAPADPDALHASDQLLFGGDLLVAPVVRPGHSRRMVYLPEGGWLELFNLERPGQVLRGPRHVIAEAPVGTTPIYLREGGGVALTSPAPHTSTARWAKLHWHLHVGAAVHAALHEDDGDGHGPALDTVVEGKFDGGRLHLERRTTGESPSARTSEHLHLYGLRGAPSSVSGGRVVSARDREIIVEVPGDWAEVELRW